MSKITIGYWGIKGRGEVLRILCEYLEVPYENKLYADPNAWFGVDKPALRTDFPNLPYVQDGEKVITETEACALYIIGKSGKNDLLGGNQDEIVELAQVKGVITDVYNNFFKIITNKEADVDKAIQETVIPKLTLLSKHLGEKDFLLGKLKVVDFIFALFLSHLNINGPYLDENLKKYLHRFFSVPAIKSYLDSERNLKVPILPPHMLNANVKV